MCFLCSFFPLHVSFPFRGSGVPALFCHASRVLYWFNFSWHATLAPCPNIQGAPITNTAWWVTLSLTKASQGSVGTDVFLWNVTPFCPQRHSEYKWQSVCHLWTKWLLTQRAREILCIQVNMRRQGELFDLRHSRIWLSLGMLNVICLKRGLHLHFCAFYSLMLTAELIWLVSAFSQALGSLPKTNLLSSGCMKATGNIFWGNKHFLLLKSFIFDISTGVYEACHWNEKRFHI